MSYLVDYVREFGKYTFVQKKLCTEDMLVFSQITYLKYGKYVPYLVENKNGITIKALSSHPGWYGLFEMEWLAEDNCRLFQEMAVSERFQNVILRNYAEVINYRYNIQFAAVTFVLPDKITIVSYRGTDELLAGWMEDCRLAFDKVIPGQEFACAYLRMVCAREKKVQYLIGHSKGGNLAEYAAMHSPRKILTEIIRVYNFDGPGQKNKEDRPHQNDGRYRKLIPASSIVGMLYESSARVHVIASDGIGMMQHNLHCWKIEGGKLKQIRKNQKMEERFQKINRWLHSADLYWWQRCLERLHGWMVEHGYDNLWLCTRTWKYNRHIIYQLRKKAKQSWCGKF